MYTQQELELMKNELNTADRILVMTLEMVHECGDHHEKPNLNDYHYTMTHVENRVILAAMYKGDLSPLDEKFMIKVMDENSYNFHKSGHTLGIQYSREQLLDCIALRSKLMQNVIQFFGKY